MSKIPNIDAEDLRLQVSTSARFAGDNPDDLIQRFTSRLLSEFGPFGFDEPTTIGTTHWALIDPQRLESVFDALDAGDSDWHVLNPFFANGKMLDPSFDRLLVLDSIEVDTAFRRQGWGEFLLSWTMTELCRYTEGHALIATTPDFRQPWLKTWLDGNGFIQSRRADEVWLFVDELLTTEQLEAMAPHRTE